MLIFTLLKFHHTSYYSCKVCGVLPSGDIKTTFLSEVLKGHTFIYYRSRSQTFEVYKVLEMEILPPT